MRLSPGSATSISIGSLGLQDGVTSSILATVFDYTNSNPLAVRLTDTTGDYVSSVTVTATNLDIRDIDAATDDIGVHGSVGLLQQALGGDLLVTLDNETVTVGGGTLAAIALSLNNLDDSVDGNYLNVNMNIAGTDVIGGAGIITAQTQRVTIATDDEVNNFLGTIDTDTSTLAGAVSGTEMQVDVVAALPAGTNAVGKLLQPDIDVTTNTNYTKKYYTSAGAVTDGIIWSPAAGKRWHIHTIYINVSAAATVTLEDDLAAGDSAIWKGELAANSGVVMPFPEKYPWASGEDAADLIVTSSAGNIYCTVSGYEI